MATNKLTKDDDDVFVVGDRHQRSESRRVKNQEESDEEKRNELMIENSDFENMKNFVGPSFFAAGIYGMFNGIYQGTQTITFRNRPKKLIINSMVNIVGKQMSRHANAGGALCLIYSLVKKTTLYLFDDDLEDLSSTQKQMVYGFITGLIFKSSRGLYPALLGGTLFSGFCGTLNYSSEQKYFKKILPF